MELFSFLLILAMGAGSAGDTRPPYVIEFKDGSRDPIHGFWEERRPQSGGWVRVELDIPLAPVKQWDTILESSVVATKERPTATKKRYEDAYAAAQLVPVNGMNIPKHQFDLAQRARRMAGIEPAEGEGEPAAVELSDAPQEQTAGTEPDSAPTPGFFEQWGAHIGLLLVAVLLTGLVVRMTFLSND